MRRSSVVVVSSFLFSFFVFAACRKEPAPASSGDDAWIAFEGIQYRAPLGTQQRVADGVLPGPGGQGGSPAGERVEATITKPSPDGFFVQIVRTAAPVSLEGTKGVLRANRIARDLKGAATETGWELTYEQLDASGASSGIVHMVYADLAGGHYQCTWGETNCAGRSAADTICRSMRAKP